MNIPTQLSFPSDFTSPSSSSSLNLMDIGKDKFEDLEDALAQESVDLKDALVQESASGTNGAPSMDTVWLYPLYNT